MDVVDPGGESSPPSLVQAAKAERERRAHAGEPVAVITDKTLPHLPKGQLTYAEPKKKTAVPAAPPSTARDEQYWRGRALEIRTRWKKTADEVKDLEQSAAGWRRRFYAENDPYARDSQVKPEWDRVLDRLGKARSEVEATRKELDDFMEEGTPGRSSAGLAARRSRAGAGPGREEREGARYPRAERAFHLSAATAAAGKPGGHAMSLKPRRVYIETWGCQMNELDSQRMAGQLMQQGMLPTRDPEEADIILLNSCSVREKAEQKVYSRLGEYRRLKQGAGGPADRPLRLRGPAGRGAGPGAGARSRLRHGAGPRRRAQRRSRAAAGGGAGGGGRFPGAAALRHSTRSPARASTRGW